MQGLAGDLGDRIPHRDLDGADGNRALGVPTRLFPLHHARKDFLGIEIVAARVDERFGRRLQDARNEAVAHLRPAGVAAGGIEGEAGDRPALANDIGDDRDHRGGHLAEIKRRVPQAGIQRNCGFTDVGDAHLTPYRQERQDKS
jgi:hypothetical protein